MLTTINGRLFLLRCRIDSEIFHDDTIIDRPWWRARRYDTLCRDGK